jgi:hypothetical protein
VRRQSIRSIRRWKADIVVAPRPNDIPPRSSLHRRAGAGRGVHGGGAECHAGRSGAREQPIFLYYQDGFQKPSPFRP